MPWCTYTDPEVAHVGLYDADAREKGIKTDTFKVEMSAIDRARTDGETEGFIKVLVRKGTDQILGATIVSTHAGEMISEISVAMAAKAGLKPGDIMIEFGGKAIGNLYDFTYALRAHKPGDKVQVKVLRNGQPVEAQVTLRPRN